MELRKHIRMCVKEALDKELDNKSKVTALSPKKIDHINNNLEKFSNNMRRLALENDNPYIKSYLQLAISSFEKDLSKGYCQMFGADEFML